MTSKEIETRLSQKFADSQIEVVDMTGTGDHYQVTITSEVFKNVPKIRQHKMVMEPFEIELKSGELHAFSIKTQAP